MIKEGELLSDLMSLFAKKDGVQSEKEQIETNMIIKMSHAFAWYDGDPLEDEARWRIFSDKVDALIQECHENGWHKHPDILSEKWVEGVLAIDECHQDEPFLDKLDQKDIVRHFFNGGTQFGLARNIQKQMKQIIRKEEQKVMDRAEKRFNDHSNA